MVEFIGRTSTDESDMLFQGVLLRDFVDLIGAEDANQITVRASDGHAASLPREDWQRWPIVLVTRAKGKSLTIRQRGPARIVYPSKRYPDLTKQIYDDRSVWLIRNIEW
ncbi:molybdopterin-dependent oxidoreductase [Roseibium sp. H3510]|uniref:Molybdopterin-dependent oxidoreductase n=2 Tax=Roseibium algae TaxID=3123038 RepID=A0ABU8TJY6_9HYPH